MRSYHLPATPWTRRATVASQLVGRSSPAGTQIPCGDHDPLGFLLSTPTGVAHRPGSVCNRKPNRHMNGQGDRDLIMLAIMKQAMRPDGCGPYRRLARPPDRRYGDGGNPKCDRFRSASPLARRPLDAGRRP